ncbi:MAG: N-acetylmuramoyl-L-alanine amidase [Bacillaceae bacterium]
MSKDVLVFLDPGHGGSDSGAVGRLNGQTYYEKDINLAVVKYAEAYLQANYDVTESEIIKSRIGDEDKSLSHRTTNANSRNAKIFISVHSNSYLSSSANGFESYRYPASDAANKKLQHVVHTKVFGVCKKFGITKARGQKEQNLYVLRETKMPAVLIELGFVSNPNELAILLNTNFQKEVGKAIGIAAAEYLNLKPKPVANDIYRVIVDGTQVGAYAKVENILKEVEKAVHNKADNIQVDKV